MRSSPRDDNHGHPATHHLDASDKRVTSRTGRLHSLQMKHSESPSISRSAFLFRFSPGVARGDGSGVLRGGAEAQTSGPLPREHRRRQQGAKGRRIECKAGWYSSLALLELVRPVVDVEMSINTFCLLPASTQDLGCIMSGVRVQRKSGRALGGGC